MCFRHHEHNSTRSRGGFVPEVSSSSLASPAIAHDHAHLHSLRQCFHAIFEPCLQPIDQGEAVEPPKSGPRINPSSDGRPHRPVFAKKHDRAFHASSQRRVYAHFESSHMIIEYPERYKYFGGRQLLKAPPNYSWNPDDSRNPGPVYEGGVAVGRQGIQACSLRRNESDILRDDVRREQGVLR